jgi:hypothetical protein
MPATLCGEVAFAAEISEDRRRCAVVAAGRSDAGKILVDLAPYYGSPQGAVARLGELWAAHDPLAIVVDPRSQAGTLLAPLKEAGIIAKEPATADVVIAHGEFLDLVAQGELEHLDQPPLTAAVRSAAQRPLAGAQAWERRLGVDQSPLVAATLAVWAFRRWEELSQPGVFAV